MKGFRALATALLMVLFAASSFAHHAAFLFDTSKSMSLKGTIENIAWQNPHVGISLNVKDSAGKTTVWFVELPSVATLTKAGLDKSLFDLTQTYTFEVNPAKDGKLQALGLTLTFPDSMSFDVREKPAPPAPPAPAK